MINDDLVKLLKANSTYHKCKNKTTLIQKRINYINNKQNKTT